MKRILPITFLLFFILFTEKTNAETISEDTTIESVKQIEEDLTISSDVTVTCEATNCVRFHATGLTVTNNGTILQDTNNKDNMFVNKSGFEEDFKFYNYGSILITSDSGGNSVIRLNNVTDGDSDGVGAYVYNEGTFGNSSAGYTIRFNTTTDAKIDNYGTITNTDSQGQTIYLGDDTNTIINNYSGATISAPNNTSSATKGAINTTASDLSTSATINNWGTITAADDTINIGTSSTINNYGKIESADFSSGHSIYFKGNNNTVNFYDGTLLIGFIDNNDTTGNNLNINLCSSYKFKIVNDNWTINDNSGCGDVVYSGNKARSSSALSQSTADENATLRVDHINEAFDYSNKKRNKNKEFGFFSKSYSDRDNGNAIDKFASLKNNAVIGFPFDNEKYSGHQIFSFSSDKSDYLNLNVSTSSFQTGFVFEDLNFFTDKKIGLKSVFGYHKHKSNRTQLNSQVASGKETIIKDYNSFSAIIGSQIQNGNIKINLDTSFERFPNYIESDDVTWNSRLVGQFMADITYDLKKNLNKNFSFNPEVGFGGRTLFLGKNQKYTIAGQDLTFNGGVQEDAFAKFALNANYSFLNNTNLFIKASAKKTTENQETYGLNFGFKSVF